MCILIQLNDVLSLLVALWAVKVAKSRGVDSKYTYGWQRAEILGALINGVFLVALCLSIFLEAIQRLVEPQVITNPKLILVVGSAGLASNIIGLVLFHEHSHSHSHGGGGEVEDDDHSHNHFGHSHARNLDEESDDANVADALPQTVIPRLAVDETSSLLAGENDTIVEDYSRGHHRSPSAFSETHVNHYHAQPKLGKKRSKSLNMEGVFLHVLGDALGNIGVIATALFIWKTDYSWKYYADPIISLVITAIIFSSALPLCRKSSSILLQGVPQSVNAYEVRADLESLPGVVDIHDLHIWILKEDLFIATLHVSVSLDEEGFMKLAQKIRCCLNGHGIHSITVQPEFVSSDGSGGTSVNSGSSTPVCALGNKSSGGLVSGTN
jgi:zinc transporter 1